VAIVKPNTIAKPTPSKKSKPASKPVYQTFESLAAGGKDKPNAYVAPFYIGIAYVCLAAGTHPIELKNRHKENPMFKEIQRAEKKLSKGESQAILNAGEYGVLSTMGEDGYPYGIPLNYVFHDDKIIFHCAGAGHKLKNIVFQRKVSFCVVTQAELVPEMFSTRFKSVIVFGSARVLEGIEKKEGLVAIVHRLSPDHVPAGEKYIQNAWEKTTVVAIDVEHMSGKTAPAPNHS